MRWGELESAAPELAALGKERFEATELAFLGTIRADGSPRISPVEPFFVQGHLLFGAMARSMKARDLARDARCVLHSVVTAPNAGEAEVKLYGRADEVREPELRASGGGWWVSYPSDRARVVSLDIDRAVFVSWDLADGLMTLRRWSPEAGATVSTVSYP